MRRLVRRLGEKDYAGFVFASTSLDWLCLGLAPAYGLAEPSGVVMVGPGPGGGFRVRYEERRARGRLAIACSLEAEAERLVDALVLRMFLTRDS